MRKTVGKRLHERCRRPSGHSRRGPDDARAPGAASREAHELVDRAGPHEGVAVEQQQPAAARERGAAVVAGPEADVLRRARRGAPRGARPPARPPCRRSRPGRRRSPRTSPCGPHRPPARPGSARAARGSRSSRSRPRRRSCRDAPHPLDRQRRGGGDDQDEAVEVVELHRQVEDVRDQRGRQPGREADRRARATRRPPASPWRSSAREARRITARRIPTQARNAANTHAPTRPVSSSSAM